MKVMVGATSELESMQRNRLLATLAQIKTSRSCGEGVTDDALLQRCMRGLKILLESWPKDAELIAEQGKVEVYIDEDKLVQEASLLSTEVKTNIDCIGKGDGTPLTIDLVSMDAAPKQHSGIAIASDTVATVQEFVKLVVPAFVDSIQHVDKQKLSIMSDLSTKVLMSQHPEMHGSISICLVVRVYMTECQSYADLEGELEDKVKADGNLTRVRSLVAKRDDLKSALRVEHTLLRTSGIFETMRVLDEEVVAVAEQYVATAVA